MCFIVFKTIISLESRERNTYTADEEERREGERRSIFSRVNMIYVFWHELSDYVVQAHAVLRWQMPTKKRKRSTGQL